MNCSTNTWQSDKGWFMVLRQQGQKLSSLELLFLHPIGGLEDAWKTFPQSGLKFKNGSPNLSLSTTTFSRYENIFIISCQVWSANKPDLLNLHCLAHHLDYLRISMKKITPVSSLDIFGPCFSSRFGGKPNVHVQPNFLWVNHSRVGNNHLNFYHRQSHHFQRWVRSNYLSTFQVSVGRFAWGKKA